MALKLPQVARFSVVVKDLEKALKEEDRAGATKAVKRFVDGLSSVYGVPRIKTKVLLKRPSKSYGELHGQHRPRQLDTGTCEVS